MTGEKKSKPRYIIICPEHVEYSRRYLCADAKLGVLARTTRHQRRRSRVGNQWVGGKNAAVGLEGSKCQPLAMGWAD